MKIFRIILAIGAMIIATPAAADQKTDRAAILAVIAKMEAAWNRGDFPGYMSGFRNPDIVFASGGKFQDGWQGILDHYVRDYGSSSDTRGTLHFYEMKVDILSNNAAMLVGRYHLERPGRAAEGVNTRLFRKFGGRWFITVNHVSAYDVPSRALAIVEPLTRAAPSAPKVRRDPPSN